MNIDTLKIIWGSIRFFPHLIALSISNKRSLILSDTKKWLEIREHELSLKAGVIFLLQTYPEFRSIFYYRIGAIKYLVQWYSPPRKNLIIGTDKIDGGLYIHLGFSSVIGAKSIGKNCMIYQQVTIGSFRGMPVIGDNVTIASGAVIIGKVKIGDNARIGANVTVMQNIPANTTVYPAKPILMKWKNKPCHV